MCSHLPTENVNYSHFAQLQVTQFENNLFVFYPLINSKMRKFNGKCESEMRFCDFSNDHILEIRTVGESLGSNPER